MKQVFLSGKGGITVFDAPAPARIPGSILIRNAYSAISVGTESSAVSSRAGWLGVVEKATRSREQIKKVWKVAGEKGVKETFGIVRGKIDDHTQIGYSSSGVVVETDDPGGIFAPGDLVAAMGVGYANHADYVAVPVNLAAKIPAGVALDEAAFGAIACIAQQGIRTLGLSPGEEVAVIGLGLIGQLTVQIGKAMGYTMYGVDIMQERATWSKKSSGIMAWGLKETDVIRKIQQATGGRGGVDGVALCAATTSSDPVNLAFDMLRQGGRVSVVGDVGLELDRAKMYKKGIDVHISRSYGPGRSDPNYEEGGIDYPIERVRWTEKRNLEYFLQLLASDALDVKSIIGKNYPVAKAPEAYAALKQGDPTLFGVTLDYGADLKNLEPAGKTVTLRRKSGKSPSGKIGVGLIGLGGFAKNVHLPNLRALGDLFSIEAVVARSGGSAGVVAKKYSVPFATSDEAELMAKDDVDAVIISTRHRDHAQSVMAALKAGKHVFVEKPMCISAVEGLAIENLAARQNRVVRVGFNRRFAPLLNRLRDAVGLEGERIFSCRVNIDRSQLGHWSNDPSQGGRFLGEGTHFLDLCNWFIGYDPVSLVASYTGEPSAVNPNLAVTISYEDGSLGQIIYTSHGNPTLGKEYFEAFGSGVSGRVDDFSSCDIAGAKGRPAKKEYSDKGHRAELEEFAAVIRGEKYPVVGADAHAGTMATWMAQCALKSARTKKAVSLKRESLVSMEKTNDE